MADLFTNPDARPNPLPTLPTPAERLYAAPTGEAKPWTPDPRARKQQYIADLLIRNHNVDPYKANDLAVRIIGGSEGGQQPPGGLSLADVTPLGLPFLMFEAGRSAQRAARAAAEGDLTGALGNYGMGVLQGAYPAAGVPALARGAARQLQAGSMLAAGTPKAQRGVFHPWGSIQHTPEEIANKDVAERMLAKGATPKEIFKATGIARDAEGVWFVETPDNRARFTGEQAVLAARPRLAQNYKDTAHAIEMRQVLDRGGSQGNAIAAVKAATGEVPSAQAVRLSNESVSDLMNHYSNLTSSLQNPMRNLRMGAVLDNPDLYARRPDIANMPVHMAALDPRVSGQYAPGRPGAIELNAGNLFTTGQPAQKSTTLHEIQHGVDYPANIDYGANPEDILSARRSLQGQIAHLKQTGAPAQEIAQLQAQLDATGTDTAYAAYLRNLGEARARVTQRRMELTPEQRRDYFPFEMGKYGYDVDPATLRNYQTLTGGQYAATPRPALSATPPEQPPRPLTLGEALAADTPTLRTLENLPARLTDIPKRDVWRQMARPEVPQEEKDLLRYALRQEPAQTIPAQQLVQDVRAYAKPYALEPNDVNRYADYGLGRIDRQANEEYGWINGDTYGEMPDYARNARTTVYRSPTPTSDNNHFFDPNYFGHTRAFEQNGIPHVIELQSDLVQKAPPLLPTAERLRIEKEISPLETQQKILEPIVQSYSDKVGVTPFGQPPKKTGDWLSSAIDSLLKNKDTLLSTNPGLLMNIESRLFNNLPDEVAVPLITPKLNEIKARAAAGDTAAARKIEMYNAGYPDPASLWAEGDLLRAVADDEVARNSVDAGHSLIRSITDQYVDLNDSLEQLTSELRIGSIAEEQRPMFKNWERRLIREEITRASAPRINPEWQKVRDEAKELIRFTKSIEQSYINQNFPREYAERFVEEKFGDEKRRLGELLTTIKKELPAPDKVRFADADTVAAVEGWPTEPNPKIVELENKLDDLSRQYVDTDSAAKRAEIDALETKIHAELKQLYSTAPTVLADKGHQSIYDRYKSEIANYLKSLGAKHIKDDKGHGWWEVPVDPQKNRRTPIFSMGGAAVGAGAAAVTSPDTQPAEQ